jgi:hypothetical protein
MSWGARPMINGSADWPFQTQTKTWATRASQTGNVFGPTTHRQCENSGCTVLSLSPPRATGNRSHERPLHIAERSSELRDLRKLADADFLRETFTWPLHAARLKARQLLDKKPQDNYMIIVETGGSS